MEWLKNRLVDDWHHAWRWWSVRLAGAIGLLVWALLQFPDLLLSVLNALPPEMRTAFPPAFSMIATGGIVLVRLWKQKKDEGHAPGPDQPE